MVLQFANVVWLQGTLALLSDEIFVESCRFATENVRCMLGVVVSEVV